MAGTRFKEWGCQMEAVLSQWARDCGAARLTARLARIQYVEGEANLQTVLDAERRLVAVEDALAVATQERLEAAVDVYRAMGGNPRYAMPDFAAAR